MVSEERVRRILIGIELLRQTYEFNEAHSCRSIPGWDMDPLWEMKCNMDEVKRRAKDVLDWCQRA